MIKLTVAKPYEISPARERAEKDHIARKSGHKRVSGNTYKPRTWGRTVMDSTAASRGIAVVGKAHFESKHFVQASVLRKNAKAQIKEESLNRPLKAHEYDELVWDSNGLKNRISREDYIRYSGEPSGRQQGTSKRNRFGREVSRTAHGFHGVCELNSAPTGMTQQCTRGFVVGFNDDKSLANKGFMAASLGFIGTAYSSMLRQSRDAATDSAIDSGRKIANGLTKPVMSSLIAFPALSGLMGFLGFLAGLGSQAIHEKKAVNMTAQENLVKQLNRDLQKLLHRLKAIQGNQQHIDVTGKAMQGRYHLLKKIKDHSCDERGVPLILNSALNSIDPRNSDEQNLNSLKDALGLHMQVEKPPQSAGWWKKYLYAKKVTDKEGEYVALMSIVDHKDLENPHIELQKDYRKKFEEKVPEQLRDFVLKQLAGPAAAVDKLIDTNMAGTLRKWASPAYKARQKAKLADPSRASKNRFNPEYMTKHLHQYKLLTRNLLKLAELLRLIASNVVVAQNANTSRLFANSAATVHRIVGTGPASRSMCQSIGRALGGAALSILLAFGIPAAAEATGQGYVLTMETAGGGEAHASATNSGILMFLLSVPSFVLTCVAVQCARLEGWKGNVAKQAPESAKTYTM